MGVKRKNKHKTRKTSSLCKKAGYYQHNIELVKLRAQLDFLRQKIFDEGDSSIIARLSRIEDALYRLNHELGVITGKVAIIATLVSAAVGLVLKWAVK